MKSLVTYIYLTEDGRYIEQDYPFGEAPKEIVVDGVKANRYYGGSATIIPEYMKATSEHEIQHYDKAHWRQKKYF